MDFNPDAFLPGPAVIHWLVVVATFTGLCLGAALFLALMTRGTRGLTLFFDAVKTSLFDMVRISPRRTWAIASLTLKEAVRRKALLVFVVFCVLFMFAGWFLASDDQQAHMQVKVYVSVVLTAITWLVLPAALLLACWGIPEDIRLRSLHTVVTKPTQRIEIVLGRIIGFSGIGLAVLSVMSVVGYVWIQRQLSDQEKQVLTCRVPVYGQLSFLSRSGQPAETGVNVGDVWKFRSYIEGATRARAVWKFDGISADAAGDSLVVESQFESFRTHKGNMDTGGLLCQFTLVNNRRADVFTALAASDNFRSAANYLRLGEYRNATDEFDSMAEKLRAGSFDFATGELKLLAEGFQVATETLRSLDDVAGEQWVTDVASAFSDAALEARNADVLGEAASDYNRLGDSQEAIARAIEEHSDSLREHLSRLAVPLPTFVVREYRAGENVRRIDRTLTYAANDEDIARFLAKHLAELSAAGSLVSNGALVANVVEVLAADDVLTQTNARSAADVLRQLVRAEDIVVSGNGLAPRDGTTFFALINKAVEDGRLSSATGWRLSADLFDDLVHNGALTIQVSCLSVQQFLGMARPDLFVRLPDRSFASGYFKAILAIGLMLVLLVTMGVCASCFVKGPVATFLTFVLFLIGQPLSYDFLTRLVNKEVAGGGFVEAVIRMQKQINPNVPLGINEDVALVVRFVDERIIFGGLRLFKALIPQFGHYTSATAYVENGFDVPWASCLLPCLATLAGFVIPCVIVGFVTLRFRELEAK